MSTRRPFGGAASVVRRRIRPDDGGSGRARMRSVAAVVGVGLVVVGLVLLPGAVANRALARALADHGTRTVAASVEVYVVRDVGKNGAGTLRVEGVRVVLPPGVPGATAGAGRASYELVGSQSASLDRDDPRWSDRWVTPTDETGYTPPLEVVSLVEGPGDLRVMAVGDLATWAGLEQVAASVGLALVGALALAGARWQRRGRHRV